MLFCDQFWDQGSPRWSGMLCGELWEGLEELWESSGKHHGPRRLCQFRIPRERQFRFPPSPVRSPFSDRPPRGRAGFGRLSLYIQTPDQPQSGRYVKPSLHSTKLVSFIRPASCHLHSYYLTFWCGQSPYSRHLLVNLEKTRFS